MSAANVSGLFRRLTEPAVEARVQKSRQAAEQDASRRLRLEDMPRFSYAGPRFGAALGSVSLEIGVLLALNALAVAAAWLGFRRSAVD